MKKLRSISMSVTATEQGRNDDGYDKLCKVRPVINMAKERFSNSYKPHKHIAIDEAMIKWTGRRGHDQMDWKAILQAVLTC